MMMISSLNKVPPSLTLLILNLISFLSIRNTSCYIIDTRIKPTFSIPFASKQKCRKQSHVYLSKSKEGKGNKKTETDLNSLIKELNNNFSYENRIQVSSSDESNDLYRCGYVGILGLPNMGKSTLTNQLLDADLSAIAPLPQTTRHSILGILTSEKSQVLFLDTPGVILDPKYKLHDIMLDAVMKSLRDADVVLWVIDTESVDFWYEQIQQDNEIQSSSPTAPITNSTAIILSNKLKYKKLLVVLNKLDLKHDEMEICILIQKLRFLFPEAMAIIPTSAKIQDDAGVTVIKKILLNDQNDIDASIRSLGRPYMGMFPTSEDKSYSLLKETMSNLLPYAPAPLYGTDPDIFTDRNERFLASEMIRQAIFTSSLNKEIPYCCEVRIDSFKDQEKILKIAARICVERDSQKGIVIGKGGKQIKDVGMEARKSLESFFGKKVFLDLSVKVDPDWRKKEDKLKEFGYINK